MKNILFAAVLVLGSLVSFGQELKPDQVIKVNTETYDFGKIKQGVPVTTFFEITNISDKPIVIESATAGCGCTTPEVPQGAIAAGATVKLKVGYNASAPNHFEKPITIKLAGVAEPKIVKIVGDVVPEGVTAAPAVAPTPAVKPAVNTTTKAKAPVKKAKLKPATKA